MAKTVISFDQGGGMSVDAQGFVGKACAQTTEKLLKGLKTKSEDETLKPEYQRTGSVGTAAKQEQRW